MFSKLPQNPRRGMVVHYYFINVSMPEAIIIDETVLISLLNIVAPNLRVYLKNILNFLSVDDNDTAERTSVLTDSLADTVFTFLRRPQSFQV